MWQGCAYVFRCYYLILGPCDAPLILCAWMGIKTYDVMLNIVHIHTENRGIPYMPLQNIANPVYTIDGSMTLGVHLCH
jgi:hypothetical protein